MREDHLLVALLFEVDEILLMGVADRGEDHHVGADDALQTLHLAGFRDARLEDRQLLVALDHQHRERHAQLRVVALGRAVVFHSPGQLLGDPLLDDGLAVRAGDAHDRAAELRPVVGRQALQRANGVVDAHDAAAGHRFDLPFDQKGPDAAAVHLGDEGVRIVVRAAHGHEQRLRAQFARERAAVGHDRAHADVAARKMTAADGGDL